MPTSDQTSQTQNQTTPIQDNTNQATTNPVMDFDLGINPPEVKPEVKDIPLDVNIGNSTDNTSIEADNGGTDFPNFLDPAIENKPIAEMISEFDLLPIISETSTPPVETSTPPAETTITTSNETTFQPAESIIDLFPQNAEATTTPSIETAAEATPEDAPQISTDAVIQNQAIDFSESFKDPGITYTPTVDAFNQTVNALSQVKSEGETFTNSDKIAPTQSNEEATTTPETTPQLSLDEMFAKKTASEPAIEQTVEATTENSEPVIEQTVETTTKNQEEISIIAQDNITKSNESNEETTTDDIDNQAAEGNPFSHMKKALEEEEKAELLKKGINPEGVELVIDAPEKKETPAPIIQPKIQEITKFEEELPTNNGIMGGDSIDFNNQELIPEDNVEYQLEGIAPSAPAVSLDDLVPDEPKQQVILKEVTIKKPKTKVVSIDMKKVVEQMKKLKIVGVIVGILAIPLIVYALFPEFFLGIISPVQQVTTLPTDQTQLAQNTTTQPTVIGGGETNPNYTSPDYANPNNNENTDEPSELKEINISEDNGDESNLDIVDHTSGETPADGSNENTNNNTDNSLPFIDIPSSDKAGEEIGSTDITLEEMQKILRSNAEIGKTYFDIGVSQDDIFMIKRGGYVSYYADLLANNNELDSIWFLFISNRMKEILDAMEKYLNGDYQPYESAQETVDELPQDSHNTEDTRETEIGTDQQSDQQLHDELQKYIYGQNPA